MAIVNNEKYERVNYFLKHLIMREDEPELAVFGTRAIAVAAFQGLAKHEKKWVSRSGTNDVQVKNHISGRASNILLHGLISLSNACDILIAV